MRGQGDWRAVWREESLRALRPWRITLKLRAQSSWAKARPMPSVAPVMRAREVDGDGGGVESLWRMTGSHWVVLRCGGSGGGLSGGECRGG
jgi:hypothetical protein